MNSIGRLIISIIFAQPLPPDFDQELASEVFKSSSMMLTDSLALRQILIAWLNRTPEGEVNVRMEILHSLQSVIEANIKSGQKIGPLEQNFD